MQRTLLILFTIVFVTTLAKAQNPLPNFSADDIGKNKVRISWVNQFGDSCIQLNVQFSNDSLKNYRSIFSTESPQLPQNGFVFNLPYPGKFYFRIFYILEGNTFYFTPAKRPVAPVAPIGGTSNIPETEVILDTGYVNVFKPEPKKVIPPRIITIRKKDSVFALLEYSIYKNFKDSILKRTRDTIMILGQDEVLLKPFDPESIYTPSKFVVTNQEGFIKLKLPEAAAKKYRLVFFDTDGKKLFTINHIPETEMVIDKTNFVHAGWFKFELYEDDKLKERNKILLQKDLK